MGKHRFFSVFMASLCRPIVRWLFVSVIFCTSALAHDVNPILYRDYDWNRPHIARAVGVFGETGMSPGVKLRWPLGMVVDGDGRRCLKGPMFHFDVTDADFYDRDDDVTLMFEVLGQTTSSLLVWYDRSVGRPEIIPVSGRHKGDKVGYTITLPKARFANRLSSGTDFAISVPDLHNFQAETQPSEMILCDIKLEWSSKRAKAAQEKRVGRLELRTEVDGQATAARMGIYDQHGRLVSPGQMALPVPGFHGPQQQILLSAHDKIWPGRGEYVFYSSGDYAVDLSAGTYQVVVAKGPDYRIVSEDIEVKVGQTTHRTIALEAFKPFDDGERWTVGETHIHMTRKNSDNDTIHNIIAAEGLNVANLLQMRNLTTEFFLQYAFGESGRSTQLDTWLVSGQEAPRSAELAHWLIVNNEQHIAISTEDYFQPDAIAQKTHDLGGMLGLAHVVWDNMYNVEAALALEAPFGTIDFIEIFQFGHLGTALWYDFLNMGFMLAPTAGSDFPWGDVPGRERVYVQTDPGADLPTAWFQGLKQGRSVVTNGPIIRLEANGEGPGAVLKPKKGDRIIITAKAALNPDYGKLENLEIVVNGTVIADVRKSDEQGYLKIDFTWPVTSGAWLAARTKGNQGATAHTGAIYIILEGETSFADKSKLPPLIKKANAALDRLLRTEASWLNNPENSHFSKEQLKQAWEQEKQRRLERIAAARAFYEKILNK